MRGATINSDNKSRNPDIQLAHSRSANTNMLRVKSSEN